MENKRNIKVDFKINENEERILEDLLSKGIYKNRSRLLRDLIFKNELKVVSLDQDLIRERGILISQSKRIGSNFNQFTKMLHSKKLDYFTKAEIERTLLLLDEIKELYQKIHETIKE